MFPRLQIGLLLIGLLLCLPAATWADSPDDPQGPARDDAIVITEAQIRAMQAHRMPDLLNHLPGVTAGDSSVSIHGSYKVKVFVDGRPINDPTSSHGGVNWHLVAPRDVARIEVLRGKGGLKYGQDASGGVILITTRRIRQLTGSLKTYGGSQGTGYGRANLQAGAGRLGVAVDGGGETTDGYKTNNDKKRWQAGAKLAYALEGSGELGLFADSIEDRRGLSGTPDHPTPLSRRHQRTTAMALKADLFGVAANTYFNEGWQHNTDAGRGLDQVLRVTQWGQHVSAAAVTGRWGEMNYGGAYQWGRAGGTGLDSPSEQTISLFAAQTLQRAGHPFSLTAGLRGNRNSAFEDALNPEVKAVFGRDHWRLTAGYSRTTNTPSFQQRFNRTSSTRPNPDLAMERADNFSLALFLQPHAALNGSLSLFHNRLRDRITYVTGDDGIGQYQNFGEVTYSGGDLALTWHPHATLTLKGSYTYMEAKDEQTGLWLPARARHQGNLELYWRPGEPFSAMVKSKSVSKVYRDKNNTRTVPAYTIAGVRCEYGFDRVRLFAEVENLFDQTYYYSDGLAAPPRAWIVGIEWRI